MPDLGVDANWSQTDFLAAMDGCRGRDPDLAIVVSAVKATFKGWASCVSVRGVRAGVPCPARRGDRTSARRSSPAPGSISTARSSSMRPSPASTRSRSVAPWDFRTWKSTTSTTWISTTDSGAFYGEHVPDLSRSKIAVT